MKELLDWIDRNAEEGAGQYVRAVRRAVESAEHLYREDVADVSLCLGYAKIIDSAFDSGDPERCHKVSTVAMPSLHKAITDLGLNVRGRKEMGLDEVEEVEDDF